MKSIAGYNISKLLAKGGMSSIYLAEQKSLQRHVVLKFLNPELDDAVKKRFIDEGRIIASLKHPHIVTVFDVVSSEEYSFISMEYLPDGDLETRLLSKLDTFTALDIIGKISEALHAVHKQGIIHGDIKPANILFRGEDCPLLTDFGISHQIDPEKEVDIGSDELYLSPTYASPELIQGKPFDYRIDLYSLGIILYEMLVGEKPFTGATGIETIANSIQKPVPQLPEALKGLQPLLESLLEKSPDKRLSDARLVTRFVHQYLKDHPDLTKQSSDTKPIDTDVVVEYIAKNKEEKPDKVKKSHMSLLFLLSIIALFLVLNSDTLKYKYITSEPVSKVNTSPEAQVKSTSIESNAIEVKYDSQSKQAELELIEKQKKLDEKNQELTLIQKELEDKKKLAEKQKNSKNKKIISLLKKGQGSLEKYQLTTPLNDNSLYYFQKVLELDKNNPKAIKGIEDIVYRYELLARSELDKYHYQKAQSFISSGLSIDNANKRLLALQKEANLSNEPKRVINKVKGFFKNL